MTLFEALSIVARVHTRDDGTTGFVIEHGAAPYPFWNGITEAAYTDAWRTIRRELHMQVDATA